MVVTLNYDATKGEMVLEELKQILLNKEAKEVELNECNIEVHILKAEAAVPEQKTSFSGQTNEAYQMVTYRAHNPRQNSLMLSVSKLFTKTNNLSKF